MTTPNRFSHWRARGFTLMEVMIVVAVISILAAVAYPSYTRYIMRAHRADAKQALLQAAQWMERSFTVNYKYPSGTAPLLPEGLRQSPARGAAIYTLGAASASDVGYVLEAVPNGAQLDDECGTLTVDSTGLKSSSLGATAEAVQRCWSR